MGTEATQPGSGDDEKTLHQRRIEADEANLSPDEAAAIASRRDFTKSAIFAAGAVAFGGLMPRTAHAEKGARERAQGREIQDRDGNTATVESINEEATEQNRDADRQHQRNNPGLLQQARNHFFASLFGHHDIYENTLVPLFLSVIRNATYIRARAEEQMQSAHIDATIAASGAMGTDEQQQAQMKEWVTDFGEATEDFLNLHAKIGAGATDVLVALNALGYLALRAPSSVMNGELGQFVGILGVNIPILARLIYANINTYAKGDDKRFENMTKGRVRQVKRAATTEARHALRGGGPLPMPAPAPGPAGPNWFQRAIGGIVGGVAGMWARRPWRRGP